MLLRYFYDENLAQASYFVGCQETAEAIVVDPAILRIAADVPVHHRVADEVRQPQEDDPDQQAVAGDAVQAGPFHVRRRLVTNRPHPRRAL